MKIVKAAILLFFSWGVAGCSQKKSMTIDELLHDNYYYAPMDGSLSIWQIMTLSKEKTSLYLGLMNQEEQMLGDWYPYAKKGNVLVIDVDSLEAIVDVTKNGYIVVKFADGESILFHKER